MVSGRLTARGRNIALLAFGCVVVLAVLAWVNRPRDEPAKATVGEAVRSFRADGDSSGGGSGSGQPALGVYRYATEGSESIDTPIIGTTHDYGGVSTIVLSAGACGELERWQVLAGRWTEGEACESENGRATATVTEFHEFFEIGQKDTFHCHSTPVSQRPGARFSSDCRSDDSSISNSSEVLGVEPVSVGGENYDTVHVETQSVLGGATSGTSKREEWRRRSDGLLLRRSVVGDADTSDAGGTDYTERYTIRLLSVTPRR